MIDNVIPVKNISDKPVYLKISRFYPGLAEEIHEVLEILPQKEDYIDFATISSIEITDEVEKVKHENE